MPERKAWTAEQDRTLKYLREELHINKWSIIAKKMTEEFDMPGRTGKQCRERYHNHLDSSILRTEWSRQEEESLYTLHDQIGNKWAIIAQKLPGRTDNCVKNHFYSRMRKAIRKLNKTICQHFRRDYKQIKMPVLYKIVEATDEKFKSNPSVEEQVSEQCCMLKNMLLIYSNDDNNSLEGDLEKLRQLASQIHDFSLKYKTKQKKARRGSMADDMVQIPKYDHRLRTSSERIQDDDEDEYSVAFNPEHDDNELDSSNSLASGQANIREKGLVTQRKSSEGKQKTMPTIIIESQTSLLRPPAIPLHAPVMLHKNSLNMEQHTDKVEELLKIQGILEKSAEFQHRSVLRRNSTLRREDSYGMILDQDVRHNNMLGESIDCMRINSDFSYEVDMDDDSKLFASS